MLVSGLFALLCSGINFDWHVQLCQRGATAAAAAAASIHYNEH